MKKVLKMEQPKSSAVPAKSDAIAKLIRREGGYVNDTKDSGGETKYGITLVTSREFGYRSGMSDLPVEIAMEIYSVKYWDKMRLDGVCLIAGSAIAEELFDTGVNLGTKRASKFLQRSLNILTKSPSINVDGFIGNATIEKLSEYVGRRGKGGETVLLKMLNCLQGAFYVKLAEKRAKDKKFIFGWFSHRIS